MVYKLQLNKISYVYWIVKKLIVIQEGKDIIYTMIFKRFTIIKKHSYGTYISPALILYEHKLQTSCLNKSLVLKWFDGLEREKIIVYYFCPNREYLVAVSHKVKSFQ